MGYPVTKQPAHVICQGRIIARIVLHNTIGQRSHEVVVEGVSYPIVERRKKGKLLQLFVAGQVSK